MSAGLGTHDSAFPLMMTATEKKIVERLAALAGITPEDMAKKLMFAPLERNAIEINGGTKTSAIIHEIKRHKEP